MRVVVVDILNLLLHVVIAGMLLIAYFMIGRNLFCFSPIADSFVDATALVERQNKLFGFAPDDDRLRRTTLPNMASHQSCPMRVLSRSSSS